MDPKQHTESAFEEAIESTLLKNGHVKGDPSNFSRDYAIDDVLLFNFLKTGQPKDWKKTGDHPRTGYRTQDPPMTE